MYAHLFEVSIDYSLVLNIKPYYMRQILENPPYLFTYHVFGIYTLRIPEYGYSSASKILDFCLTCLYWVRDFMLFSYVLHATILMLFFPIMSYSFNRN